MKPKVLKMSQTALQHLNFPSEAKIAENAFGGSKLKYLIVENCDLITKNAL